MQAPDVNGHRLRCCAHHVGEVKMGHPEGERHPPGVTCPEALPTGAARTHAGAATERSGPRQSRRRLGRQSGVGQQRSALLPFGKGVCEVLLQRAVALAEFHYAVHITRDPGSLNLPLDLTQIGLNGRDARLNL